MIYDALFYAESVCVTDRGATPLLKAIKQGGKETVVIQNRLTRAVVELETRREMPLNDADCKIQNGLHHLVCGDVAEPNIFFSSPKQVLSWSV